MKTLDEVNLAQNDRAAVVAAATVLRQEFPVEQVVLFGSRARGQADEESDLDLLVLTARPVTWDERREMIRVMSPIQREHDVMISLLIVARQDWSEGLCQVLPIHHEVERDGVVV